ncbi:MAG: glutamate-5-semialdehyde dehydrogenase [Chloroflexi bacterium]|nr:glutamate-5-semialdehyde dehydrogenase [Chloroflexota bacterium]
MTLETFSLGVDPVNQTLVPVIANALAVGAQPSPVAELESKAQAAKAASRHLARLSSEVKNRALLNIAEGLLARQDLILKANAADYEAAEASGLSAAMLDRLMLNRSRLEGMARDVRAVAALPDPVGEVFDMRTLPNGLQVGRKRVPLGVIGSIYESRPNVTVDISVLCLKSGNAVLLRGGSETIRSNQALVSVLHEACARAGAPEGAVQFVDNPDRSLVNHMLRMKDCIDLVVPRGGAGLIKFVAENAAMPVVTGGVGVCHTYVDRAADLDKALKVVHNAKTRRPTICNALDTLLVHSQAAGGFLPLLAQEWARAGVEMRCDKRALSLVAPAEGSKAVPAREDDWGYEFLALVAAVKVVDSLDEAIEHIERYGSGHSEAIVTEDYTAAMRFLDEVDAAAVYVNTSTQFTDGGQFGLGAEVGISTQKLHARGPMGLREMTTYKWIILGNGHTRPL